MASPESFPRAAEARKRAEEARIVSDGNPPGSDTPETAFTETLARASPDYATWQLIHIVAPAPFFTVASFSGGTDLRW